MGQAVKSRPHSRSFRHAVPVCFSGRDLEWAAVHSPLQALLREFVADSGGEGGPLSASSAESSGRPSSDGPPQKQDGGGGGGAEGGCRASGAIYELLTSANSFWKVGQGRLGYLPRA